MAWLVRKVHSAILSKPLQGIKNLLKMKISPVNLFIIKLSYIRILQECKYFGGDHEF